MAYPRFRAPDHYDPRALFFASVVVGSLYWNRRDKLEEFLNLWEGAGTWQIISWQFRPNLLQPSMVVFQVTGGHVYVGVTGSLGVLHWAGNIEGGAMPRTYGPGTYAHTFFYELADDLYNELLPLLPPNLGTIRLTGHSLGSACINLMGNFLLANNYDVEILNFAEPRSVSAGFEPPHTDFRNHLRVYVGNDGIGWLPQQTLGQYWLFRPGLTPWSSDPFTWGHYGARIDFNLDGTFQAEGEQRDNLPFDAPIIGDTIVSHPIRSYMRAMEQIAERNIQGDQFDNLRTIAREIYNQSVDPDDQNIRINANQILNMMAARAVLNIPPDAPQDIDFNLVEWGGFELTGDISTFVQIHPDAPTDIYLGANNMAGSSTNLWKVEFLIEDGKYWYTESHVHNESLDSDGIFTAAENLWEVRRKLVGRKANNSTLGGGSPGCTNVRCSQVLHPKIAFSSPLKNKPYLGEFDAQLGSCDLLEAGVLLRMHATQPGGGTVAEGVRHFPLRAVSDEVFQDGRKVANATFDPLVDLWGSYLINNNWGLMVQDINTPNDKKPITAFAQDPTTKIWTLDVDATNYSSNDTVRITNTSVPEMNGSYKIVKVSNSQIKLIKGPQTVSSQPLAGDCQRVKKKDGTLCKVFAKYDNITMGRECHHDTKLKLKKSSV